MISLDKIVAFENLYMAWEKIEKSVTFSDVWYDEYSFHQFKFNLDAEINRIREQILNGIYKMQSISPIPFPKGGLDEDRQPKVRQAFSIAMADQLVWVAICNILGPVIEKKMPSWSFGNRLFVPMWKEPVADGKDKWVCGGFMNSYPFIYRKWKQSWPRYRKVLTASIKNMAKDSFNDEILDDNDRQQIDENADMPEWMSVPYLEKSYFSGNKKRKQKDTLFWMGIDLEKYYPSIDLRKLYDKLESNIECEDGDVLRLVRQMLSFEVDKSGYDESELAAMGLSDDFTGLPTGLIVGGWLANVYLIDIDKAAAAELATNRHILHFRYVDDHTFVADDFEELIKWAKWYIKQLDLLKLKVNSEKIQPLSSDKLQDLLQGLDIKKLNTSDRQQIENDLSIDPRFPSPLMTLTLEKVSQISHFNLNLLTENEAKMVFHDLQSFINVDLPEAEIKKETRISFAGTVLSRMLVDERPDWDSIYRLKKEFISSLPKEKDIESANVDRLKLHIFDDMSEPIKTNDRENFPSVKWSALDEITDRLSESVQKNRSKANRIYYLLLKAINATPEKVNIWIRALEFCIRHLPDKIPFLLKEIEAQKQHERLHELTALFLKRQLHALCAARLVATVWDYCRDTHGNNVESQSDLIKVLTDEVKVCSTKKSFVKGSDYVLKIAQAFSAYMIRQDVDKWNACCDECFTAGIDFDFVLIWLIEHCKTEHESALRQFMLKVDLTRTTISDAVLMKLIDLYHDGNSDFQQKVDKLVKSTPVAVLMHYPHIESDNEPPHEQISLWEFIQSDWKEEKFSSQHELISLILIKRIVDEISQKPLKFLSDDKANNINLFNVEVERKDMLEAFTLERALNGDSCRITITDSQIPQPIKDRFSPIFQDGYEAREDRVIYQIGVVLYHLLSGESRLEWYGLNRASKLKWSGRIRELEETGNISTITKDLLKGCLLPTSWESRYTDGKIKPSIERIKIKNINTLQDRVASDIEILRKILASPKAAESGKMFEIRVINVGG